MVYVNRAGVLSRRRSLIACLREQWDAHRARTLVRIQQRNAGGVPLADDKEGAFPLKDPGPFEPDGRLEGVEIVLRVAPAAAVEEHDFHIGESVDIARRYSEGEDWRDIVESREANRRAERVLISAAVAEVHGLTDDAGPFVLRAPFSPDDMDTIERAELLGPLAVAARGFQSLTEEERGNYGGSLVSTSGGPTSTATDATSTDESSRDATAGLHKYGFEVIDTNPTPAPGESSLITPGSGGQSNSTNPPEAA